MTNLIENLSSLSENGACKKRRSYKKIFANKIAPSFTSSPALKRSQIIKKTIKNCIIYNIKDGESVMEYMNSRYVECGFVNPQQKMQILLSDWRRVMRYLNSETRPGKLCSAKEISIDPNLPSFRVHPDMAFPDGDSIELVFYKIGKPSVTQSGDKNKIKRDLQLYAAVLYGRQLGFKNIKASFYYLAKKTDSSADWASCDTNFFGSEGGNIITLVDLHENDNVNTTDMEIKPSLMLFKEGIDEDDQDENSCKYCDFYHMCKYKKPPISVNMEVKGEDQID